MTAKVHGRRHHPATLPTQYLEHSLRRSSTASAIPSPQHASPSLMLISPKAEYSLRRLPKRNPTAVLAPICHIRTAFCCGFHTTRLLVPSFIHSLTAHPPPLLPTYAMLSTIPSTSPYSTGAITTRENGHDTVTCARLAYSDLDSGLRYCSPPLFLRLFIERRRARRLTWHSPANMRYAASHIYI